ncbi:MAG: hypothetical protein JKY70_04970 [Mucilaginibacter sp.]|nr:hypothetical protein [Mucilaginibacter sp.]
MEKSVLPVTDRHCKDCGAVLGPGREDRQYCDATCRTNFNNRKRRELQEGQEQLSVPNYITRIQEIQLKNRSILEGLCTEELAGVIAMRDLLGMGFNPKFFTSEAEPTDEGVVYRFCFEYGYKRVDTKAIVVCRRREVR